MSVFIVVLPNGERIERSDISDVLHLLSSESCMFIKVLKGDKIVTYCSGVVLMRLGVLQDAGLLFDGDPDVACIVMCRDEPRLKDGVSVGIIQNCWSIITLDLDEVCTYTRISV